MMPIVDRNDIKRVLEFWFCERQKDAPKIDGRMARWLDPDPEFDATIQKEFGNLVQQAATGNLLDWETDAEGRLALILLLDQFHRRIENGRDAIYQGDERALRLCADGVANNLHGSLTPEQRIFFFMPLQRTESITIQQTSVEIYKSLVDTVSETMRETFVTFAQFAELHRDIIAEFGRFPHRNKLLGRQNTEAEKAYLAAESTLSNH